MIPKVIHYCWFGKGQMPDLALDCIESWKKYLPEYKICLWDENNFDINCNFYTREAYEARKFAFVTDYVRLYALYNYGGVYMDTDVEVLKNLDEFLILPAFSGFEDETKIPTGIMASEKGSLWAKEQLAYYTDRHFIKPDGSFDMTSNVDIIGNSMAAEGFVMKNSYQNHKDKIHIYPKEYFCPKSYHTGKIYITEKTYCVHHFAGSWLPQHVKLKIRLKYLLGERFYLFLKKIAGKK